MLNNDMYPVLIKQFTEVVMRTFSYSVESKWMSPYTNAGVSGNEGSNTIWCVVDLLWCNGWPAQSRYVL
jgi:hypothetical protein